MNAQEARELTQLIDRAIMELLGEIREVELSETKPWLSKHHRRPFGKETEEEYGQRLSDGITRLRKGVATLRETRAMLNRITQ